MDDKIGNHNYEGQIMKWPNEKGQKDKQLSTKHYTGNERYYICSHSTYYNDLNCGK